MSGDHAELIPLQMTAVEVNGLFVSRKRRKNMKNTEEQVCKRRRITKIDWTMFNDNWTWPELVGSVLALAKMEEVCDVYIGISQSCIWRWEDCHGHQFADSSSPVKGHAYRFDRMYPLTADWSEPIVVMEEDLIAELQAMKPWGVKSCNDKIYRQGPVVAGAKYFLYACVIFSSS